MTKCVTPFVVCLLGVVTIVASIGAPAAAQDRNATDAAAAFSLDSLELSADKRAAVPAPRNEDGPFLADPARADLAVDLAVDEPRVEAPNHPALDPPARTVGASMSWLDVPIASLIANPTTKRVLDHDLPGLSGDANLPKFQHLSLREFQPLTGGQLTDALLAKVETDIRTVPPTPPPRGKKGDR